MVGKCTEAWEKLRKHLAENRDRAFLPVRPPSIITQAAAKAAPVEIQFESEGPIAQSERPKKDQ
jgi:hypothetical protein